MTLQADILTRLEETIAQRRTASHGSSYVAKLNAKGIGAIAQKLGEEATEAVIAAISGNEDELIGEAADLVFHLLVLLSARDIALDSVLAELRAREGLSGIEEKAARKE